ncbi:MAG: hypothetical protein ACUVQG_02270 [Thermogutta sp.]
MVRKGFGMAALITLLLTPLGFLWAQSACEPACQPASQPAVTCVQKTIMMPQWVIEMRKVRRIERVPQECEVTVNVVKWVPETKMVEQKFTEWVMEPQTKEVRCVTYRPVWKTEVHEYTVMVPKLEKVQGTRKVCKMVPVTETRKICVDEGHWEDRPCEPVGGICRHCHRRVRTACNPPCGPATDACAPVKPACVCKVWVPNPVVKEIQVTCLKPQWVEEPFEYTKCTWVPEKRTREVKRCVWECQESVKQITYNVCVPRTVVKQVPVTVCKKVCEPVTKKYIVMVPQCVEKAVPVRVRKMVPQTITVPVQPCLHHRVVLRRGAVCCDP